MNARERMLAAIVVGLLLVVAGVFVFHQFFWAPLKERNASISALRDEVADKQEQIRQAYLERPRLSRWRQLSLPADMDVSRREYEKFLSDLLREDGFDASVTPKPPDLRNNPTLPGKKPIYTRLGFTVLGRATFDNLVKFLEDFYRAGFLHQIKNISIQRTLAAPGSTERPNELDVNLTVEALIVHGAGNRPYLLPNVDLRVVLADCLVGLKRGIPGLALAAWNAGPTGPAGPRVLAQPTRRYQTMLAKNIFFGPPTKERALEEVVVSRFVYLTDVTQNAQRTEAYLYDRYNNRKTRLRAAPGFDQFRVTDADGKTLLQGKVVRIEARDLYFESNNRTYCLHIGQSLEDALAQPAASAELTSRSAKGRR